MYIKILLFAEINVTYFFIFSCPDRRGWWVGSLSIKKKLSHNWVSHTSSKDSAAHYFLKFYKQHRERERERSDSNLEANKQKITPVCRFFHYDDDTSIRCRLPQGTGCPCQCRRSRGSFPGVESAAGLAQRAWGWPDGPTACRTSGWQSPGSSRWDQAGPPEEGKKKINCSEWRQEKNVKQLLKVVFVVHSEFFVRN